MNDADEEQNDGRRGNQDGGEEERDSPHTQAAIRRSHAVILGPAALPALSRKCKVEPRCRHAIRGGAAVA